MSQLEFSFPGLQNAVLYEVLAAQTRYGAPVLAFNTNRGLIGYQPIYLGCPMWFSILYLVSLYGTSGVVHGTTIQLPEYCDSFPSGAYKVQPYQFFPQLITIHGVYGSSWVIGTGCTAVAERWVQTVEDYVPVLPKANGTLWSWGRNWSL